MKNTAEKIFEIIVQLRSLDHDDLKWNDLFNNLCDYHKDHIQREYDEKLVSDWKEWMLNDDSYEDWFQEYLWIMVADAYCF